MLNENRRGEAVECCSTASKIDEMLFSRFFSHQVKKKREIVNIEYCESGCCDLGGLL